MILAIEIILMCVLFSIIIIIGATKNPLAAEIKE